MSVSMSRSPLCSRSRRNSLACPMLSSRSCGSRSSGRCWRRFLRLSSMACMSISAILRFTSRSPSAFAWGRRCTLTMMSALMSVREATSWSESHSGKSRTIRH